MQTNFKLPVEKKKGHSLPGKYWLPQLQADDNISITALHELYLVSDAMRTRCFDYFQKAWNP